jgi:hypothetical protein
MDNIYPGDYGLRYSCPYRDRKTRKLYNLVDICRDLQNKQIVVIYRSIEGGSLFIKEVKNFKQEFIEEHG